ncbi:MAG TPA: SRPBCC family protein [Thermoanaerobaculia bacterium]|nr:SRPBCC family protein [Thermoanaerobaculia bacterium]
MSRRAVLERTTRIDAPLAEVFEFFSTPANLGRITPPSMGFRITAGPERRLQEGDRIDYAIRVFGLSMRWTTRITLWREREVFADLQERGPYRYWHHTHTFRAADGGVEMHDRVEYELPFGFLGRLFGGPIVRRQLDAIFAYRAEAIRNIFGRG